jgi:hypothetical protein
MTFIANTLADTAKRTSRGHPLYPQLRARRVALQAGFEN